MFEKLIGNESAKRYLRRMADSDTIGNSLLFAGPEGVGKTLFAQAFAEGVLGSPNHPDLHIYRPEGKTGMHAIQSMRQLSEDVYLAPFAGTRKFFIIEDADRMLPYSANALLKTFEEPALDSVIILTSQSPRLLLPTIISRCRSLYFQSLQEHEIADYLMQEKKIPKEEAMRAAAHSAGSLGKAVRFLEGKGNAAHSLLLDALAQGAFPSYKELEKTIQAIADAFEESYKPLEESITASLWQGADETLSAVQRQQLEKETEGVLAMRRMQDAQSLFDIILGWHRDMQLILLNGNKSFLFFREEASRLEQTAQQGRMRSFEDVQRIISNAKISLERSVSLPICLENIMLELEMV
jgi:DNA polymerase-3 subunit delta'